MFVVLTSPPTQYRLYSRLFYRSKESTNSIKLGLLKEKMLQKWRKPRKSKQNKTQQYNKQTHTISLVYRIGLCSVLRPLQHSIGYTGNGFYRSEDPTNSIKVLKENLQKKITQRTKKTQNTHAYTQNGKTNTAYKYNTASPLVYTNMGWLGDSSHRAQGCQAWTAVGLPPRYPKQTNIGYVMPVY